MNKICVSDSALNLTIEILENLKFEMSSALNNCKNSIGESIKGLEENFAEVIKSFVDMIGEFNSKIELYCEENLSAITERKTKIMSYEDTGYVKINMY